jgi:hypothetical protein
VVAMMASELRTTTAPIQPEGAPEERICSFDHYSGQLILCDMEKGDQWVER